ncbi:MAG: hypothetical protein ONB49_15680, partial [candidate division KSB1 bacterium]|nr:hypothetical protein [candidate division KSB1 bacterium]
PRDNNFYLAINTAAKASLAPAALEAAFINPANWTWHDGTTGRRRTGLSDRCPGGARRRRLRPRVPRR